MQLLNAYINNKIPSEEILQTKIDNQRNQRKRLLTLKLSTFNWIRKRVNCRDINQVTPKYQMNFLIKPRKKSKTKHTDINIKFYILEIVSVSNFSLNWKFWFLDQNNLNRVVQKMIKNENHHWIVNIRISIGFLILSWCETLWHCSEEESALQICLL